MTLNIELPPEQEARLTAVAQREGLDPEEVDKTLVARYLPPITHDEEQYPTLALFAQWDQEDQNMTAAEIAEENWKVYPGL